MKRIPLLLTACLCCGTIFAQTRPFDVQHYAFSISLNDSTNVIEGSAEIKVQFTEQTSTADIDLVMKDDKTGKGMTATQAWVNGAAGFVRTEKGIRIMLKQAAKAGDTASIYIVYSGIPKDGLIISKTKFGKRTFFADNWPDRAHNWIPCVDIPGDKAPVDFTVSAPDHYRIISNGVLISETAIPGNRKVTHWQETNPLPPKVMVIGAADFAVEETGSVNGVPVSSWVFADARDNGFHDYKPAKDILGFFMDYIGPYAYKKLANVQSATIFGGMENASCIFYFENSVTGKGGIESLLAHEIVHQWFGDMATEKAYPHLWLSEGFATYLTHIYIEKKYGTDSLENEMRTDREAIIEFANTHPQPVVDSISPTMSLLNANSYQKGGWILHMLRNETGDSAFHRIIRTYYERYKGKNAETRDLQTVAEEISGMKLDSFFRQWLFRPGMPELKMGLTYMPRLKRYRLTVTQSQTGEPFRFPLEFRVTSTKKKIIPIRMNISQRLESILLPAGVKPAVVAGDPHARLLYKGDLSWMLLK